MSPSSCSDLHAVRGDTNCVAVSCSVLRCDAVYVAVCVAGTDSTE